MDSDNIVLKVPQGHFQLTYVLKQSWVHHHVQNQLNMVRKCFHSTSTVFAQKRLYFWPNDLLRGNVK